MILASYTRAMRVIPSIMQQMITRQAPWRVALASVIVLAVVGLTFRADPASQSPMDVAAPENSINLSATSAYPVIFAAQERGDFAAADLLIAQLSDPTLLGYVLAQRYQHPRYQPTAQELTAWLTTYHDHPQVSALLELAKKAGVTPQLLAKIEVPEVSPLKGEGYASQMGRSAMPSSWYTGLRLWKEGSFWKAAATFNAIARDGRLNDWQRSAGAFWAYRAYAKTGNIWEGIRALTIASQFPDTFYGKLALAQNGQQFKVVAALPQVPDALWNDPAIKRAQMLMALDRSSDAEMELRTRYSTLSKAQRPALVTIAAALSLPNLQMRLAQLPELSPAEAMGARFPMPKLMLNAQQQVDPALLLAVARNESGFRERVRNPSGATGMMQILPSTAQHILKASDDISLLLADNGNDGIASIHDRLNDMQMSAKLGAAYFTMLQQQPLVGNNLMRLLAAYNAGPGSVANWQKTAQNVDDPLLYLESIPYTETRNYVMQVMTHFWVYQSMMGEKPESLKQLASGQWPVI